MALLLDQGGTNQPLSAKAEPRVAAVAGVRHWEQGGGVLGLGSSSSSAILLRCFGDNGLKVDEIDIGKRFVHSVLSSDSHATGQRVVSLW